MSYRMDASAARGVLSDYLAEDDEEVTSPERISALADALHDALREIEGHREDAPAEDDEQVAG